MRPIQVKDDRGTRRPLCVPTRLPVDAPPSVRALVERASAHTMRGIAENLTAALTAAGTIALLAYTAGGWPRGMPSGWAWSLLILVLVLVALGTGLAWIRAAWSGARVAKASCLGAGICPSCGYPLAAVPGQQDGCTVCPECGAAWRVPGAPAAGAQ